MQRNRRIEHSDMKWLLHLSVFLALAGLPAGAQTWRSMGPPGGDVRALAADPRDPSRLYLGTTDGHIFGSRNGGESWELLGRAGPRLDGVITAILVDPRFSKRLYASLWTLEASAGGGIYRSDDGGKSWQSFGLEGQAVRTLAQAESDPNMIVAGTLEGIFRTRDGGKSWERISPEGHEEIRNLDSIAIDPRDPRTIYAGTFHLPWKTTDGGRTWRPIHEGMIDDSDVMSMVIDRVNPERIYASACSGIYRSENGGKLWAKVQGIPYSARRTHVIAQDPLDADVVYAGTTEGLWRSKDGGATWERTTPKDWVINALVPDASTPHRLVMGTERLGVMVSDNGGKDFRAANEGFHHRQIVALALDRDRPGRVLAVLTNAPDTALATEDGGEAWGPLGPGLDTEKLLRVYASPGGWWVALEGGGLMRYEEKSGLWIRWGALVDRQGKPGRVLASVVTDMAFGKAAWYIASPDGLFASADEGATWKPLALGPVSLPVSSVRASRDGQRLWIVSLRGMVFSKDAGATWTWHDLPLEAGGAMRLDVADDSTLLATARRGLYVSRDAGKTWQLASAGLPDAPLRDLAISGDVVLAAMETGGLYISYDRAHTWTRIEGTLAEGHFPVITTPVGAGTIFAASASEGVFAIELAQPAGRTKALAAKE
jgi:photosystem II stability/assembly factor-like uncharacterized protein